MSTVESIARPRRNGERRRAPTASISKESPAITGVVEMVIRLREMRLRLGKVTVADVLAAQPVTTNLLKFMRASIKMIGVSNLQSFIASMTQKLTLSDISDESKNYLD